MRHRGRWLPLCWPVDALCLGQCRLLVDHATNMDPEKRPSITTIYEDLISWPEVQSSCSHLLPVASSTRLNGSEKGALWESIRQARAAMQGQGFPPVHGVQLATTGGAGGQASRAATLPCNHALDEEDQAVLRLQHPGFRETPESEAKFAVCETINRCNLRMSSSVCCRRHAMAAFIESVCLDLNAKCCEDGQESKVKYQCPQCTMMEIADSSIEASAFGCASCGYEGWLLHASVGAGPATSQQSGDLGRVSSQSVSSQIVHAAEGPVTQQHPGELGRASSQTMQL